MSVDYYENLSPKRLGFLLLRSISPRMGDKILFSSYDGSTDSFDSLAKYLVETRRTQDIVDGLKQCRQALGLFKLKLESEGLTEEEHTQYNQILYWIKAYMIALGHERIIDMAEILEKEPGQA